MTANPLLSRADLFLLFVSIVFSFSFGHVLNITWPQA